MTNQIDPRCPWITVSKCQLSPRWELTDFWYHASGDEDNDGSTNVYILAWNADNTPAFSARAVQMNGGTTMLSFKENPAHQAQADFAMSHDSIFYPDQGQVGVYSVCMQQGASDVVHGMGLPVARHVQYWLLFKYTSDTPQPPAPPPAGDYVTRDELYALIQNVIKVLETY
jgi:hypothetical protein